MRIVFIDPLKSVGGQEIFFVYLARALQEKNFRITFLYSSGFQEKLKKMLQDKKYLNFYKIKNIQNLKNFIFADRNKKLVICNGERALLYIIFICKILERKRAKKTKIVYIKHLKFADSCKKMFILKKVIYLFMHKFVEKLADYFVTPSQDVYSEWIKKKKNKCFFIENGIKGSFQKNYAFASNKFPIGFLGRLDYQKNINLLLKAFQKVSNQICNASLTLIGDGDGKKSLILFSKKLNLKNVHFLGFKENIFRNIKNLDFLVFPSFYEGNPLSLLQCISCSILPILSDIPGHRQVLRDRNYPLYFKSNSELDLKNKIILASSLTIPQKRRLSKRIKKVFLKRYSNNIMEKKYKALFYYLENKRD